MAAPTPSSRGEALSTVEQIRPTEGAQNELSPDNVYAQEVYGGLNDTLQTEGIEATWVSLDALEAPSFVTDSTENYGEVVYVDPENTPDAEVIEVDSVEYGIHTSDELTDIGAVDDLFESETSTVIETKDMMADIEDELSGTQSPEVENAPIEATAEQRIPQSEADVEAELGQLFGVEKASLSPDAVLMEQFKVESVSPVTEEQLAESLKSAQIEEEFRAEQLGEETPDQRDARTTQLRSAVSKNLLGRVQKGEAKITSGRGGYRVIARDVESGSNGVFTASELEAFGLPIPEAGTALGNFEDEREAGADVQPVPEAMSEDERAVSDEIGLEIDRVSAGDLSVVAVGPNEYRFEGNGDVPSGIYTAAQVEQAGLLATQETRDFEEQYGFETPEETQTRLNQLHTAMGNGLIGTLLESDTQVVVQTHKGWQLKGVGVFTRTELEAAGVMQAHRQWEEDHGFSVEDEPVPLDVLEKESKVDFDPNQTIINNQIIDRETGEVRNIFGEDEPQGDKGEENETDAEEEQNAETDTVSMAENLTVESDVEVTPDRPEVTHAEQISRFENNEMTQEEQLQFMQDLMTELFINSMNPESGNETMTAQERARSLIALIMMILSNLLQPTEQAETAQQTQEAQQQPARETETQPNIEDEGEQPTTDASDVSSTQDTTTDTSQSAQKATATSTSTPAKQGDGTSSTASTAPQVETVSNTTGFIPTTEGYETGPVEVEYQYEDGSSETITMEQAPTAPSGVVQGNTNQRQTSQT